jgi:ankyrin repeat protein
MKAWAAALFLSAAVSASAWAQDAAPGSALLDAVRAKDSETAMQLVRQRGVDVDAREPDGSTALMWAAHHEDAELVRQLIRRGADVNAVNDYGVFAMQEAAAVGNAEILELLLGAGADVESPNLEGQTALMAVARTGRTDAAQVLIDAGADVNAVESWGGQTALMWAAAQSQADMIRTLIAAGADPDAQAPARDWVRLTSEPRIKEMFSGGFTPLIYAAREGCAACVHALIDGGADPDKHDPDGQTPIIAALLNSHFAAAAALVERGADPNKWDWWGRTPLYAAADMNITPNGARIDLPSMDVVTGLDVARMLLEAGADPNLRLKNNPLPRNIVFDRGQDGQMTTGATALMRAAYGGDLEMMNLLLDNGARVDIPNIDGVSAFSAATASGGTRTGSKTDQIMIEAMEILLDNGADVNERGRGGVTPLHTAARGNRLQVAEMLIARGADLSAADSRGLIPRDYAIGRADQLGFGGNNVVGLLPEMADLIEAAMREQGMEVGPREAPLTTEELIAAGRGRVTGGLAAD